MKTFVSVLLIVGVLSLQKSHATSIVVLIAPDRILIAADTKSVVDNGTERKELPYPVPKIFEVNNRTFAMSGAVNFPLGLSMEMELITELNKVSNNSLFDFSEFKKIASDKIKKELYNIKNNKVLNSNSPFKQNGATVFNCVVIGYFNGEPYASFLACELKDANTFELSFTELIVFSKEVSEPKYIFFGQRAAMKAYLSSKESFEEFKDYYDHLEKLITLEANKNPKIVGLPVTIIEYSAKSKSGKWIKKLPDQ